MLGAPCSDAFFAGEQAAGDLAGDGVDVVAGAAAGLGLP